VQWELTAAAAAGNRSDAAMAWWRGAAWLLGGGNYSEAYNVWADVYRATPSGAWNCVTADAGWHARAYMAAAVSGDDALVVAGGGRPAPAGLHPPPRPPPAPYPHLHDAWGAPPRAPGTPVAAPPPPAGPGRPRPPPPAPRAGRRARPAHGPPAPGVAPPRRRRVTPPRRRCDRPCRP